MARKITYTEEGKQIVFSTKRGHPDQCSETCSGVYTLRGELYCEHFGNYVGKRDPLCVKNEKKGT